MPAKSPSNTATRAAPIKAPWTFLTNHSHVLICLWRRPDARLRDVAEMVGITERAVQAIVADLEEAGVLTRTKHGRRNHYTLHEDAPLRHPVESAHRIGELLNLVGRDEAPPPEEET
ncbi:MAG: winged helix-turn-helix domain-containing protein [Planctomycetota bacterium]